MAHHRLLHYGDWIAAKAINYTMAAATATYTANLSPRGCIRDTSGSGVIVLSLGSSALVEQLCAVIGGFGAFECGFGTSTCGMGPLDCFAGRALWRVDSSVER
ncbi:hypothetical protein [Gaiella sp.]|uniref:hypothetical protein n=1 Tax=Gaiella sp. TaxID=2663207 RepID=UPI003267C18B